MAKTQPIPSNYSKVLNRDQIAARIAELAAEIGAWAADVKEKSGEQLLAVCMLRGGVHFFSDLLRALPVSVEAAFCRTWSYSSTQNAPREEPHSDGGRAVRVSIDDVVAEGRYVLLVDDICDSGVTLERLTHIVTSMGALEVKSAVLIRRTDAPHRFRPSYVAFNYPGEEWFVGYGMDDRNSLAHLPELYSIPREGGRSTSGVGAIVPEAE